MVTSLLIVASALVAAVVIGAAVLLILASGENAARRARLVRPDSAVTTYLDRNAPWAASISVVSDSSPEAIDAHLKGNAYLSRVPLLRGPSPLADGRRTTSATFLSYQEEVVERIPGKVYTTMGTGISIPFVLVTLAQRFQITPNGGGSRVEWTLGATPRWIGWLPLRWTGFIVRPVMKVVLTVIVRQA